MDQLQHIYEFSMNYLNDELGLSVISVQFVADTQPERKQNHTQNVLFRENESTDIFPLRQWLLKLTVKM